MCLVIFFIEGSAANPHIPKQEVQLTNTFIKQEVQLIHIYLNGKCS